MRMDSASHEIEYPSHIAKFEERQPRGGDGGAVSDADVEGKLGPGASGSIASANICVGKDDVVSGNRSMEHAGISSEDVLLCVSREDTCTKNVSSQKKTVVILDLPSSNQNVLATLTALATSSRPPFRKKWCDFHKWGFHSNDECKRNPKNKNSVPGYTPPRSPSQPAAIVTDTVVSAAPSSSTPMMELTADELAVISNYCLSQTSNSSVCSVSPGIVINWISKMISKVFQWSLSGYNSLNKESKHREHGKSSILELLHFKLSKSLRIISEAQWVEASAGVKWVNHLTQRPTGNTVALDSSHQDNLCSPNSKDALSMHQAWVAQVVKPTLAEDLSSGFEPHGLTELDSIARQELGEDTT
ncbi:hypothetical protein RJ640_027073 [Escallonia rubra]|uniref:Uncharacterized protein n=1 Tax=Escallonia rubra TaxID=112253 RepID=A0AA88RP81_9ASTE|nr:hypothetical protein RJ640_027073 [Escallonia rubra]